MDAHFKQILLTQPRHWVITGVAGFIGSHLLKNLLQFNQRVTGIDDFSAGCVENLQRVQQQVSAQQWQGFQFIKGDVRDPAVLVRCCQPGNIILHHAALSSVPASLQQPQLTHDVNVNGFVNVLEAARARACKVVFASSSAVYGDCELVPAVETKTGNPLSPYALSKKVNEQYAAIYHQCFRVQSIGLRYFNVFGEGQDPNGPYAAVIPTWLRHLATQQPITIYGDGFTTRDFCPVENIVAANLYAALSNIEYGIYNVGLGQATSLNQLAEMMNKEWQRLTKQEGVEVQYQPFRAADVRHSCADIHAIEQDLRFTQSVSVAEGLAATMRHFLVQPA